MEDQRHSKTQQALKKRRVFEVLWPRKMDKVELRAYPKIRKKCTGQRLIAHPFWPEEALLSVFGLLASVQHPSDQYIKFEKSPVFAGENRILGWTPSRAR